MPLIPTLNPYGLVLLLFLPPDSPLFAEQMEGDEPGCDRLCDRQLARACIRPPAAPERARRPRRGRIARGAATVGDHPASPDAGAWVRLLSTLFLDRFPRGFQPL